MMTATIRKPFIRTQILHQALLAAHMAGKRERADWARWVLSLFSFVLRINYRGKETKGQIEQIKTCRKKQHVKIDDVKEMSDLFCGRWEL